jgi:hypothetical protein
MREATCGVVGDTLPITATSLQQDSERGALSSIPPRPARGVTSDMKSGI